MLTQLLACLCGALLMMHCARQNITISPGRNSIATCAAAADRKPRISAVVFWRTEWRINQKDVPLREKAAQQGIEQYFARSRCYRALSIQRFGKNGLPAFDRFETEETRIFITVKELGPWVSVFGSFWLLEGGTEVQLEVALLPAKARTASEFAEIHWRHGGPWVIKGVASLPANLRSALAALLEADETGG